MTTKMTMNCSVSRTNTITVNAVTTNNNEPVRNKRGNRRRVRRGEDDVGKVRAERGENDSDAMMIGPTASEPTKADVKAFNELVSLGTWQSIVPECKRMAKEGSITKGVLGQAYIVLSQCKKQKEDEQVIRTLENMIQLLTQTLLTMKATPEKMALDELMAMNPDFVFNGKEECANVLASTGASVDDVVIELQQFLKNCELQDAAFERDIAMATETDNKTEFERLTALVTAKMEAKRRTLAVLSWLT